MSREKAPPRAGSREKFRHPAPPAAVQVPRGVVVACVVLLPGVGRDSEQCFRSGAEQDAIDLACILKRQPADLLRQREDHVKIGYRQQFGLPFGHPERFLRKPPQPLPAPKEVWINKPQPTPENKTQ